jgi:quercetin dioxygenase-like cupin family protein
MQRVFPSQDFWQPTAVGDPMRSVVCESIESVVVAWYLQPGQTIAPHVHPQGTDTWTILAGKGRYFLDSAGNTQEIIAGDIVVAPVGCIHGVINEGLEPLKFISVVSPGNAGYELWEPLTRQETKEGTIDG